jgi:hypothetical protein
MRGQQRPKLPLVAQTDFFCALLVASKRTSFCASEGVYDFFISIFLFPSNDMANSFFKFQMEIFISKFKMKIINLFHLKFQKLKFSSFFISIFSWHISIFSISLWWCSQIFSNFWINFF